MLIVYCYFPLVLYVLFHKSSSDVVTLPPVNWDFQQFAEGNFEGILTDSCNNGHGGKDHIARGDTNWLRNTGKVKNNSPNQKFPPSVRKATNLDDTTDKKVHQLFLISEGPRKGAVCLDGSPPGLYLRKGSGSGKSKWTIFFQGGAWCHDTETCYQRSGTALGSSRCYGRYLSKVEGLLSNEAKYNPDFFNWTSVFFPYCDGASFSGNRAKPLKFKKKLLYFRGHRIMDALLDELLQRGIGNASEIILAGRSAGALSAIIHADYIRSRLRSVTNASFRVLSDAGFFLDEPSLNGSKIARSVFQQMYSLHNSSTGLNQACLRAQKRQYKWRCFFPQYSLPFLSSPIFLVNSLNDLWQLAVFSNIPCVVKVKTCHSKELRFLAKFRKKTLHALRSVFDSRKTAVFADACLAHTQCAMNDYWTQIEVFFVDYGNSEWTSANHVKRMLPHFLHLPFQALECFLGNVEPIDDVVGNGKKWSPDAISTFKSLTEDKVLIAHILSKAWNQTIYVDLFDTEGEEIHINKVLIERGLAKETDHTVSNPWNIEASFKFNPHMTFGLPG